MLSRRRLFALSLILALGACFAASAPVRAEGPEDMLKIIPDDAWGFVMVRSLDTIEEKAKILRDIFGPGIPPSVTGQFLSMMGLSESIDMTKPLCIIVMDWQKFGDPKDAAVILVPTKDGKALVDKLAMPKSPGGEEKAKPEGKAGKGEKEGDKGKEQTKESGKDKGKEPGKDKGGKNGDEKAGPEGAEGVTKIALMGQPAFAAVKDKIVIVGPNEDCVLKVSKAKKTVAEGFDKSRLAAVGKSDLFINIAVADLWNGYKDQVGGLLTMVMAANDPSGKTAENLLKMIGQLSTVDLALSIDKNGVSLAVLTTAKKDSDLEKLLKDTKNTSEGLLKGLPKEKYLLAVGGTAAHSEYSEKFGGSSSLASGLKSAGLQGLDEEATKALETGLTDLAKSSTAWALSAAALPEGPEGMIGITVVVEAKDSKAYIDGIRKIYKTVWDVSKDENVAKIKKSIVHTPDAETVGDQKVDTIAVNLKGLAEVGDVSEDEIGKIEKIAGKGCTLRFGAADDKHVVVTFGGGKERYKSVCDSVKSGKAGLVSDSGITAMSAKLPSPRAAEGFIAVDNILGLVKGIAKALGEESEIPFDVPTIDAPVAFSSAQVGNVQQMDLVVPMKLITSVKELIEKQAAAGGEAFDEEEGGEGDEESEGKDEGEGKDDDEDE